MTTLTYEPGSKFFMQVIGLKPTEVRILCPVCGAEVLFAPDHATAARLKMHAGFVCSKDPHHVCVTFSIGRAQVGESMGDKWDRERLKGGERGDGTWEVADGCWKLVDGELKRVDEGSGGKNDQ